MNVVFINEEYFKKVVPHTRGIDGNQIISAIRLVQDTDLQSVLTNKVYDHMVTQIATSATLTDGETALFNEMQMYLALKAAEQLFYIQPTRDDEQRDLAGVAYRNKATIIEARMVRVIKNDDALLTLAGTSAIGFDDVEMSNQGGFYFD